MGWMMGIEPTTTGATIRGSTTELHPPLRKPYRTATLAALLSHAHKRGAPSRIRTCNLRLRRPLLYPVELWAHSTASALTLQHVDKKDIFIDMSWSGWRDSNPRHPAPKAGALPDCATPRRHVARPLTAGIRPVSARRILRIFGLGSSLYVSRALRWAYRFD